MVSGWNYTTLRTKVSSYVNPQIQNSNFIRAIHIRSFEAYQVLKVLFLVIFSNFYILSEPEARSIEEKVRKASQLRSRKYNAPSFWKFSLNQRQECYKFGLEALLHFRKKNFCRDKQRQTSSYFEVLGLWKTLIIKLAVEQSPSASSPVSPPPASGGSLIDCSMPPPLYLHPQYVHLLNQLFTLSFLVDPSDKSIYWIDPDSRAHHVTHHLGQLRDDTRHDGQRSVSL